MVNGRIGGADGPAGSTVQLSFNGSDSTTPLFLNVASKSLSRILASIVA